MAAQAIGPDVSRWQGDVDWKRVHGAGAGFAVVKATEGLDFVDPTFTPGRIEALQASGLLYTAYHFARPQLGRTGAGEAKHFLKVLRAAGWGHHKHELPLVLDIESSKLNAHDTQRFIASFVREIHKATGERPIIYTYPAFWRSGVGDPQENFGCKLWIANYGVAKPDVPRAWKSWTFWQHTDRGHVAGVSGACDMNRYHGTFRELRTRLLDAQPHKPPKPPKPKPPKPRPRRPHPPAAGHYPKGLPAKYRTLWDHPWRRAARTNKGFRRWLDQHGYLSPHFRISEARCKDGTQIPESLNKRARDHAFNLEKLRHQLGDRPLPIISWYRTPAYNRRIGGASASKHMEAIATDHAREWVDAVGRAHVMAVAGRVFSNGGLGVYPWGAIHVDTRGSRARWSSW